MEIIFVGVIFGPFLYALAWLVCEGPADGSLSIDTMLSIDFQTCQQMRDQGFAEEEIIDHVDYYDKDFNYLKEKQND